MYRFKTSDGKTFKTLDSRDYFSNYSVNTIITVSESSIIRAVPDDFLGFSISQDYRLNTFMQNLATYPQLTQLFLNLKPAILRVGGTPGDYNDPLCAKWEPDGAAVFGGTPWYRSIFTKAYVDTIFSFLQTIGWKAIWQLNLAVNNPSMYADEANYIYQKWGSRIVSFDIGNEPEAYVLHNDRSTGYGYPDYKIEWESYKTAIKSLNPNTPLAGIDSYVTFDWLRQFAIDEHTNIAFISKHFYPTDAKKTGDEAPTIDNLLSQSLVDKTITRIQTFASTEVSYGLQTAITETNSTSSSGTDGVSNVFASALWGLDYMFTALELGIKCMNFHGAGSDTGYYKPFDQYGIVYPIYYAFLAFCHAAPNGNSVLTRYISDCNVRSHAVVGADGKLRVVIINKDIETDAKLKIVPSGVYSSASAMFLSAPSVSSATGTTFGGMAVSELDGTWQAGIPSAVQTINGSAYLTVPKASAAVVTFTS